MTTAWAYIRVSGDDQADRGLPVEGQRASIQAYAEQHGVTVQRWYVDEARTGGNDRRDAFQRMMADAHDGAPEHLVILLWSWSRFARNQNDAHFWKASLRRRGVDIRDVSGETPEQLPPGFEWIFESLIHWKDAQARAEISRNARRGQQTLAQRGYIPSGCRPPRGYKVEIEEVEVNGKRHRARRWVPDPATWERARRAWDMRLAGRSYTQIIQETRLYKTPGCLSTFFGNRSYTGKVNFGGTIIEIPAMVTEEEWRKVNHNRQSRQGGAYPRRQGSAFLLSGIARCARCGAALVGIRSSPHSRADGYSRGRWEGYMCPNRKLGTCDLPRVSARPLEQAVTDRLLEEVLTPETLEAELAAILEERDRHKPEMEASAQSIRDDLQALEQGMNRLVDAIEASGGNDLLLKRLQERQNERERLRARLEEIEAELSVAATDMGHVEQARESLRTALQSGDIETIRPLVRALVAEVIVDDGEAQVRYHVPF